MAHQEDDTVNITQFLSETAGVESYQTREMGRISFAPAKALEPALRFSRERFGIPLMEQMVNILRAHLIRRDDKLLVETLKVQDASTSFSKVCQRARDGQYQLVGGFQKGSEPVMVISLQQLAEVIGHVMEEHSLVDLLPNRPPLDEPLPLTTGDRATSSAVTL